MLGAIIGDIVGSRFEFNNHCSKDFALFAEGCFATDDSIMTLAAKAIMETSKAKALDGREANAKSRITNEGIVVLAGSIIREDIVPSCPDYAKAVREDNKENIDENSVLQKDLLFKTPSGASTFVLGAPTSGNVEWKTEDGKALKDIEASEASES